MARSFGTFAIVLARALFSSLSIALATFVLVGSARAQEAPNAEPEIFYPPPRAHVFADLSYVLGKGTRVCPDESRFRELTRARTGTDSFHKNPRGAHVGRVRVEVTRTSNGFSASYTWEDAEGAKKAERFTLQGASRLHCRHVVEEAAAHVAALFIDIEVDLGKKTARRRGPAKKCPVTLPCPPPPAPVESNYSVWPREPKIEPDEESARSKLPDRWPLAVRLGAGVGPELIVAGRGSVGLSAELGVRYRFFSVGAELHGDPPLDARAFTDVGLVSFGRLSGALLVCGHYRWFVGCGVGDVGRIFFPQHVPQLPASTLYGAVGMRAGIEVPVAPPWLFLRAVVDLRTPIIQQHYEYRGTPILEISGLGVGAGFGVVVELPR